MNSYEPYKSDLPFENECQVETCREECKNGQSICDLIESAALTQTALAHILNAEGEKIQKAVAVCENVNDLLEVNRSVNKTIISTTQLEQALYQQLDTVNEICQTERFNNTHRHCTSEHEVERHNNCYSRQHSYAEHYFINCITCSKKTALTPQKKTEYYRSDFLGSECEPKPIFLKSGKYTVKFKLEINKECGEINSVSMKFIFYRKNKKFIKSVDFSEYICKSQGLIKGEFVFQTPNSCDECFCSLILKSPCCAKITGGITVTKAISN